MSATIRLIFGIVCLVSAFASAAEPPATDRLGDPLPVGAVARIGTSRLRHPGCRGMAWSGELLATGSEESVCLWDARTGKKLRHFGDGRLTFTALALSPDGKTLAVAEADGDILLWDTTTDKEPRRLSGHLRRVVKLAFARDGTTLASASFDCTAGLWDVASGKLLHSFRGHEQLVRAIAIAPDGQSVASGDLVGQVIVWDAKTGKERVRTENPSTVMDLAFAPDGKTLASADVRKRIHLCDPATGKGHRECDGHGAHVTGVTFSGDGKTVLSGSADGTLRLWDAESGKELRAWPTGGGVCAVAFAPDGRTAASAGPETPVRFWDAATGKSGGPLPPAAVTPIEQLAFGPDGKSLLTVEADMIGRRWDTSDGKHLTRFPDLELVQDGLAAVAPDGRIAAVWGREREATVSLVEAATGKRLRSFPGETTWQVGYTAEPRVPVKRVPTAVSTDLDGLVLSSDSRVLAGSTRGGRLIAWQTESGIWLAPFLFPTGAATAATEFRAELIQTVALSPDGKLLFALTGLKRPTLRCFEIASGQEVASVVVDLKDRGRLAIAPDGRTVAVWGTSRQLFLWDSVAGGLVRRFASEEDCITAATFSTDGRLVAAGTAAGEVCVRGTASGKELCRFCGHAGEIRSLAFAPDDRLLASGSADTTALLWAIRDTVKEATIAAAEEKLAETELVQRWNELVAADEKLLEKLIGPRLLGEGLRSWRAIEVLEKIGTPEARQVLEKLAEGTPGFPQIDEARASLDRLARRPAAK